MAHVDTPGYVFIGTKGRRSTLGKSMGVYSEYLNRGFDFPELTRERKRQLRRIAAHRERPILVYAADLTQAGQAPISIDYSDVLPISDQVANLDGDEVDVVLETSGGSGEVAEDIVRLLRSKFESVAFIIPGAAKSAGTIIAMSGDEILMGPSSSLGPIDAQLSWQGKTFSADALLEGMEKIKSEVEEAGTLNKAYIPILQAISPGELQSAENALDFAKRLVTDWLANYKFQDWDTHSSTGEPVTRREKEERAEEIAAELCDHSRWLTHGRSIKMEDLRGMRLLITDYTEEPELADAVRRYHTLLRMSFDTNIYKLIETPESQVYRFVQKQPSGPSQGNGGPRPAKAHLEITCGSCGHEAVIQANLAQPQPLEEGLHPYPKDDRFTCPSCGTEHELSAQRRQIEAQAGIPVVPHRGGTDVPASS